MTLEKSEVLAPKPSALDQFIFGYHLDQLFQYGMSEKNKNYNYRLSARTFSQCRRPFLFAKGVFILGLKLTQKLTIVGKCVNLNTKINYKNNVEPQ